MLLRLVPFRLSWLDMLVCYGILGENCWSTRAKLCGRFQTINKATSNGKLQNQLVVYVRWSCNTWDRIGRDRCKPIISLWQYSPKDVCFQLPSRLVLQCGLSNVVASHSCTLSGQHWYGKCEGPTWPCVVPPHKACRHRPVHRGSHSKKYDTSVETKCNKCSSEVQQT